MATNAVDFGLLSIQQKAFVCIKLDGAITVGCVNLVNYLAVFGDCSTQSVEPCVLDVPEFRVANGDYLLYLCFIFFSI